MAPNANTQPSSVVDAVDRLLAEREQDYQGALQIFRNDVKLREQLLNELGLIGLPDEEADAAIAKLISDTRRGRRDAVSEGSYLFENDLRNYAAGLDPNPVSTINKTEAGQRRASQPIPGTEAHHPASVSSTEALVQNMDEYEIRNLWQTAKDKGYTVGSQAEGFIPLSKPAHTTGGRNWGPDFAHVGADGKTPDPGRFKTIPLPKGTNATQAWGALKPVLDEQQLLNERAYNHPVETRMRADAEATVGKPIEWRGPVTADRAATNATAKGMGLNATTITQAYDRNPGLLKTNEVPNVTVAVPGGGRVPVSLGKPPKPQPVVVKPPTGGQVAKASATAKPIPPPTVKPVPRTRPVGTQATLGGKPVVWNGKSWAPVLPNRLAQPTKPKPVTRTSKTAASPNRPASVRAAMSQQERLREAGAHPILIHPGMSLPSNSLIQGI